MNDKKEYEAAMGRIDVLMKKGENKLTGRETDELRKLSLSAQKYEKSMYSIPAPKTIEGMIELKMYELKLTQSKLAKMLGVTDAKLSQILNGKRSPDLAFLKAVYEKLKVDADFLLSHV